MTKAQLLVQEKIRECRENQDTFLDLGNYALRAIPDEVFTLTHLTKLNLGRRHYTSNGVWKARKINNEENFAPNTLRVLPETLLKLEHLEELGLEGNPIQDLSLLTQLTQLKVLNLCNTKSADYTAILSIPGLEALHLGENRIIHLDIFQTAQCKGLKVLDLTDNYIREITDLENLPALEILALNVNYLTHMRGVRELTTLRELYLELNAIEQLEALEKLVHLETLSLGYLRFGNEQKRIRQEIKKSNGLKKIEGLDSLTKLKTLDLGGNSISEIAGLETLIELEHLWLNHNSIHSIDNVAHLVKLKTLGLGLHYPDFYIGYLFTYRRKDDLSFGNLIPKIENLETLANLENLYLDQNKIQEINQLDDLQNLALLNLNNNQITEIKSLDTLTKLNNLSLEGNQITEIKNLDTLINLNSLNLWSNQITEIKNLDTLTQLNNLSLGNNQITEIKNLDTLINLNSLNLWSNQITEIKNLDTLINLNSLSLGDNQITEIKNLDTLTKLNSLSLGDNQITEIKNLDTLINLNSLSLGDNQITEIKNLDKLINLTDLNLWSNQITEIKNLDKLINLNSLSLGDNQITEIKNLDKLINLNSLSLGDNQITEIQNLDKLINLNSLSLGGNQITEIQNLDKLINLNSLSLGDNQITEIQNLDKLINLNSLSLEENQISEIKNLDKLTNLGQLFLRKNEISEIKNLDKLIHLSSLSLWDNHIIEIKNLDIFIDLSSLDLDGNQISEIKNLDKLINLTNLDLRNNQITEIKNLDSLISLESLSISENKLKSYPSFSRFTFLQQLNLAKNQLMIFESHLLENPYLTTLNLSGQVFTNIANEITEQENCLNDARNWFKALDKESVVTYEAKLILMGNGRVGKTCILKRFFFNTYTEGESSTHGIQLYSKDFPDFGEQALRINAWDFGGQEIYHATHRLFMQSRALFMVAWDVETEKRPFEYDKRGDQEMIFKNYELSYWLDHARALSNKSPLLVVQTKIDLHKEQLPEKSNYLQEQFEINKFEGVSAATNAGFRNLKATIFEAFEKMPEVGMRTPTQWIRVKEKLLQMKSTKQLIPYPEYLEICGQQELSESEAETLIRFLHNTGNLFYHSHLFNNLIILDQEWALKGIYAVVQRGGDFYEILQSAKGNTTLNILGKIWKEYPLETQKVFLSMMENCEICFQTTEHKFNPGYLIPEFLPEAKHDTIQAFWEDIKPEELSLKYQHDFFHPAFMTRFICRAGRLAKSYDYLWKNGIWITYGRTHALIEAFPAIHQLQIRVRGQYAAELIYRIHKEFKEIFYKPEKVNVEVRLGDGEYTAYTPPKREKTREKNTDEPKNAFPTRIDDVDLFSEVLDPESDHQIEKRLKEIVPAPKKKPGNEHILGLTPERIQKLKLRLKSLLVADLEKTVEKFDLLLKDGSLKNDLINKRGELSYLQKFVTAGSVDYEKAATQTNQIRVAIIALIDQIELSDLIEDDVIRFLLDG